MLVSHCQLNAALCTVSARDQKLQFLCCVQKSDQISDREGLLPRTDHSVEPSGSDASRFLIYDTDTEGKQLAEIRGGKNIPATFWRTNRSPDLCLEGTAKLIFIEVIITEELPALRKSNEGLAKHLDYRLGDNWEQGINGHQIFFF